MEKNKSHEQHVTHDHLKIDIPRNVDLNYQ